jgi:hypothetical protein
MQQFKCDRCSVVADSSAESCGHHHGGPPAWTTVQVSNLEAGNVRLDLCPSCYREVIDRSGLALPVQRITAEAQAARKHYADTFHGGITGSHEGDLIPPHRPWRR